MDERLKAFLTAQVSDEELAALVDEARAAALAEVRGRLRDAFVAEMLGRLAGEVTAEPLALADARSPQPSPAPSEPLPEPSPPPADDLATELAALRAQLAANRSWLTGDFDDPAQPPAPEPLPPAPEPHHLNPDPRPAALLWVYAVRRAVPEAAQLDVTVTAERIAGVAEGEPLFALPCGDLEALVSAVPAADFDEGPLEANLRDLDWLERVARSHQAALTSLMGQGTLVPLRFATLFSGRERVAAMVAERADELRAALDHLEGRGEWGVKLFVDEGALAERLAEASPAVRELREAIAAKPAGAAYMLQKRLDRLAAEEARRVSDACADDAHARLGAASIAAERGALREAPGAVMLLNGAYLVADTAQPVFAAALDELRAAYGHLGFRLELTGPWPPYTFAAPPAHAEA